MRTLSIIPNQRVSLAQKEKNDFQLMKDTMDAIINNFYAKNIYYDKNTKSYLDRDYHRKISNYMLFNNQINQEDFIREINTHGFPVDYFKDKEIQPYNKAPNKIQVLLGEELMRPKKFRSAVTNADGLKLKLIELQRSINQSIDEFYNNLRNLIAEFYQQNQQGQLTPEQTKELEEKINQEVELYFSSEKLSNIKNRTFVATVEKKAQAFANSLARVLHLRDVANDGYKHLLIGGDEVIWVGVVKNKLVVEPVNSISFIYDKNENTKYIEDSMWAGRRNALTKSEAIAKWNDKLKPEDLKKLEEGNGSFRSGSSNYSGSAIPMPPDRDLQRLNSMTNLRGVEFGQYGPIDYDDELLEEIHLEWKSLKQVYFIEYINEYGDPEITMASEDYLIPDYAITQTENIDGVKKKVFLFDNKKVYQSWIEEVWQGVKLGNDTYLDIKPREYQYRSIDDPYTSKLGYIGTVMSNMNAPAVSMMDRMKPFIYLYLLVAHRLKEFIAQDRAPLVHFDISMVDPKVGVEKTMYYMDQLNIDVYNPLMNAEKPGGHARGGKTTGSTVRTTMQHINNYIALLAAIDDNISDVAGITRQREGQTSQYEAVGNNQQAIIQSAHITQIYFHTHEMIWERVMNCLVYTAMKFRQDKPTVMQYISDDLEEKLYELLPSDWSLFDLGIFFSNSMQDEQLFNKIEQLTQYMLSGDKANIEDVIQMMEAQSISELKGAIKDAQKNRQMAANAAAKQQEDLIQKQLEADKQKLTYEYELKEKLEKAKGEIQIELKEMDVFKYQRELDSNNNNVPDHLEVEKLKLEERKHQDSLTLEREKIAAQKEIAKSRPKPTSK